MPMVAAIPEHSTRNTWGLNPKHGQNNGRIEIYQNTVHGWDGKTPVEAVFAFYRNGIEYLILLIGFQQCRKWYTNHNIYRFPIQFQWCYASQQCHSHQPPNTSTADPRHKYDHASAPAHGYAWQNKLEMRTTLGATALPIITNIDDV